MLQIKRPNLAQDQEWSGRDSSLLTAQVRSLIIIHLLYNQQRDRHLQKVIQACLESDLSYRRSESTSKVFYIS